MAPESERNEKKEISKLAEEKDVKNIYINDLREDQITEKKTIVYELQPLSRVGFTLSKFLLAIICVFIFLLLLMVMIRPIDASDSIDIQSAIDVSDSTFNRNLQIIQALQEEKKNYRDFILSITQMILLNLLLPTLTAVLGYIFGSRSENRN